MMKQCLIAVALAVSIAGCVPAALVIGATAGGAVLYDKRSMKGMVSDHKMSRSLKNVLARDEHLQKKAVIHVHVYDGIVLLVGQVETPALKAQVSEEARGIASIKRVYNELQVTGAISAMRGVNDSWVLSKVKLEMMAKPGLQSTNMSVVVNDGNVYLMGSVSHKQASIAAGVARRISGVKRVVKVFEYE